MFKGTIFDTYPFLLPNVVCTAVVVFGLAVGFLFLEETHEDRKYDLDRGRKIGQWFLQQGWLPCLERSYSDKDASLNETRPLLDDHDNIETYCSTTSSPTLCSTRTSISDPSEFTLDKEAPPAPSFRDAFTKQVCLNVICYGILALYVSIPLP